MKVLALVTGPFYRGEIHGGSYRILRELLIALAGAGHEVTLLSGHGPHNHPIYHDEAVTVKPILPLKRLFPNPWSINLSQMLAVMSLLEEHVRDADIVYNHDSQFMWCLPTVRRSARVPIIASIRDFVYEDTLRAIFGLTVADRVIANSSYALRVLRHIDRQFALGLVDKLVCIENGVDLDFWQMPSRATDAPGELRLIPKEAILLVAPVRPELNKGIIEALRLLTACMAAGMDAHLVACRYVDEGFPNMPAMHHALSTWKSENSHIAQRLHIIPWLDSPALRALYQRATATLCLGTFPEAFGSNVYVESVAAGTPCICSAAAAMRSTLPRHLSFVVAPGDLAGALEALRRIIRMTGAEMNHWQAATATIVKDKYDIERMKSAYTAAITNTVTPTVSVSTTLDFDPDTGPPWRDWQKGNKTYDDFLEQFVDD